jgi:flagellar hook-associated protein 2
MSASPGALIQIATFSGTSTYSSSFQQVLTRAVQIASLPGLDLESTVGTLTNQETALTGLESAFSALETDIDSVNTAAKGGMSASVSDSSILSASASASATEGTYTVTVDDLGSAATALSNAGSTPVTDPSTSSISDSSTYTLNVNGTTTTITPTGTSLDDLASAINSAGAGVQATIVDVGGSSGNDYRLALTTTTMGQQSLELDDSDGNALTTQQADGSSVEYTVNGSTDEISNDSRIVNLAPGLTVTLASADPSTPVTITVGRSTSNLANALSTLVNDYNSAVTALTNQTGSADGALEGDSIIYSLRSMLSSLLDYSNTSGSVANLNSLGLEVDSTGSMTFDASTFDSLSSSDIAAFLGSTSSTGFLESAYNSLDAYTNSDSGVLYSSLSTIESSITADNGKLSDDEAQVSTLQSNLMSQLSAADASIATLQSQVTYYQDLFQAEYSSSSSS